jgi:acetyltransferase-like isoleucine patch superfamily enzyme
MRRLINNLISCLCSLIRFSFLKLFHFKGLVFHFVERFSPNVVVEIGKNSTLILGKMVRVHSGSKIKVRKNAKLVLESGVKINYNCIIACHKDIKVGAGTQFGPSVYLYDHDHDYKAGLEKNKFLLDSIEIGKNCWIGANTVILRGTKIGDNSVVGAGCVLKGEFPANSVIVQKRMTDVKTIG